MALGLVFVTMLAAITLTDLERRMIPNKILIVAAVARARDRRARPTPPASPSVRSPPPRPVACSSSSCSPTHAGWASATSSWPPSMGLFLGRNVAPAILVALLAGSVVGLALIARHGAEARKLAIPFGPFLALGGVVGLLAGNQLVDLYLSTFS